MNLYFYVQLLVLIARSSINLIRNPGTSILQVLLQQELIKARSKGTHESNAGMVDLARSECYYRAIYIIIIIIDV